MSIVQICLLIIRFEFLTVVSPREEIKRETRRARTELAANATRGETLRQSCEEAKKIPGAAANSTNDVARNQKRVSRLDSDTEKSKSTLSLSF